MSILELHEDLARRGEATYRHLQAGDDEPVGRQMTILVRRVLDERKVMGVWSQVVETAGDLQRLGPSFVRPSGRGTASRRRSSSSVASSSDGSPTTAADGSSAC